MLIPFHILCQKHNIAPKGVLHVGASEGQEAYAYYLQGVKRTIWIEAIPDIFNKLVQNIKKYPDALAINACVSDVDGNEMLFNIASNDGQSSSLLELGTHKIAHPSVHYTHTIEVVTRRIDTLLSGYDLTGFDFLTIDLQGAELLALKGMGELIDGFKYAYIEVNREELYKGCAMVWEIDEYLKDFERVETKFTDKGWGDALYIKKEIK